MSHLQQTAAAADFDRVVDAADEAIADACLEALFLDPEAEARIILADL